MRRSFLLLAVLVVTACGTSDGGGDTTTAGVETTTTTVEMTSTTGAPDTSTTTVAPTTTTSTEAAYPVTVEGDNGSVTLEERPDSIVSMSATATEMLFAIGAGDQVVAVDDQSNYPEDAPITDLSSFTPNVEAVLAYEPDLVVISFDPGELIPSLGEAGVPVVQFNPAPTLDDTYRQIAALGAVTGRADEAAAVNATIESDLNLVVDNAPDVPEGTTYYHEVDNTLYTATSSTFIGLLYGMFGLENIADPADEDGGAGGYPQLTSEYVVAEDPDLIFLANTFYGESAETVAARPGWDALSAIRDGNIVELDSDVVSRWGPRIVEFGYSVADALEVYSG